MNKILYIILISLFSLTIISCSSSSDGGGGSSTTTDTSTGGSSDTIAPKIFESVKVVTHCKLRTVDLCLPFVKTIILLLVGCFTRMWGFYLEVSLTREELVEVTHRGMMGLV